MPSDSSLQTSARSSCIAVCLATHSMKWQSSCQRSRALSAPYSFGHTYLWHGISMPASGQVDKNSSEATGTVAELRTMHELSCTIQCYYLAPRKELAHRPVRTSAELSKARRYPTRGQTRVAAAAAEYDATRAAGDAREYRRERCQECYSFGSGEPARASAAHHPALFPKQVSSGRWRDAPSGQGCAA